MNEYAPGDALRTTRPLRVVDGDVIRADYPAGTPVVVRRVESHGSNPWTRYVVETFSGMIRSGTCPDALAAR